MATVVRVTRVANPRRRAVGRKSNPRRRRRLTPKQIKYFGTKRQKNALKRRSRAHNARRRRNVTYGSHRVVWVGGSVKRPRKRKANPRRKKTTRRNPALVVTLGAVNPTGRKTKTMAQTRKRRRGRRRTNPSSRTAAVVYRYKRSGSRRRNPSMPAVFGTRVLSKGAGILVLGGLTGVAAAKLIPGWIPLGTYGSSVLIRTLVTGVSAVVAGQVAGRFVPGGFGDAVLFGGLMQTASMALNALMPGFKIAGVPVALSGMGELMPASFPVPQNPLKLPPPPTAPAPQARVSMNGLTRAFGTAL